MNTDIRRECRSAIRDITSIEATMEQFSNELDKIGQFDFYSTIQSLEK